MLISAFPQEQTSGNRPTSVSVFLHFHVHIKTQSTLHFVTSLVTLGLGTVMVPRWNSGPTIWILRVIYSLYVQMPVNIIS